MPPALEQAIALHKGGRLDDADRAYRALLERQPNNADALHFLGLLTHQRGDTAAAIELMRRATVHAPRYVDAFSNLGNLLRTTGRFDEAELAYRRAIEIDERHVPALTNLGRMLTSLGRHDDAVAYHYAAVAYDPHNPDAARVLGLAYHMNGEPEKAKAVFRDWLAREPANPVAAHLFSACAGEDAPDRATDEYLRTTFDSIASRFDESLAERDYQGPRLIADAFARVWPHPRGELDVLDAGCGTGLCAPLLRPYARCLVGVDLSAGMLARAEQRGLYDELHTEELTAFLGARHEQFDAIAAADTLIYFGTLTDLFRASAQALRPGARFVFTAEHAADGSTAAGYRLEPHGRYSHETSYVEGQLRDAGFYIDVIGAAVLRMEAKVPVAGLVGTAIKRS